MTDKYLPYKIIETQNQRQMSESRLNVSCANSNLSSLILTVKRWHCLDMSHDITACTRPSSKPLLKVGAGEDDNETVGQTSSNSGQTYK